MKLIHLSDLHFGTEDQHVVDQLLAALQAINPDYVIISGDFAQIGSRKEFELSRTFLDALPCPYLCVPGNHDVPARDLVERFFDPYKKYKRYITDDLCPVFENDTVVIVGLNSARRALPHWNWANGAISEAQRQKLRDFYNPDESRWTICTFHHPIHKVDDMPLDVTVFGRKRTLQLLQDLKIDLVLTGHVHHASMTMRGDEDHQSVFLSASTALSSRTRGQENGFNLITLCDQRMKVEMYKLVDATFKPMQVFEQHKTS